jgi:subtilisin family serine protease
MFMTRSFWLRSWLSRFGQLTPATATTPRPARLQRTIKPELQSLEDRLTPSGGSPGDYIPPGPWDTHMILVQFKEGVNLSADMQLLPGVHVGERPAPLLLPNLYEINLDDGVTVESALAAYNGRPDLVDYADPNWYRTLQGVPNDTNFGQMYGLNNTGQSGGTADADIDAPEAWDITTGSGNFIVADLDTGVDYNHPDLKANLWVNPGEVAGDGIDNDKNGWVDDIYGVDVGNNNGNPIDTTGHGTHTFGTIGAVGNNNLGVTGVNWHVKVMAIRIFSPGYAGDNKVIQGLNYAVANGAKVSNNSWGGGGFSNTLFNGIKNARNFGHIFVCAAGNAGSDNDANPFYPANFNLDNVVSVGASDRNDKMAGFSCFGANTVDLFAPGVSVLSTVPVSQGSYDFYDGTSMACPHVTGAIALLWDNAPTMTYKQVIARILSTVDVKPAFAGKCVTGGRLNIFNALNRAPTLNNIANQTINELSPFSLQFTASDPNPGDVLTYSLVSAPPGATVNAATGLFTWTPTEAQGPGTYTITAKVTDNGFPQLSDQKSFQITVNEVNDAPVFNPGIGNKTVNEGSTLSFTVTGSDTEGNPFFFTLASAPVGATINPNTGLFSWTPGESVGPGTVNVTFRIFQNTPFFAFTDETIQITVNEVNVPPVLGNIGNKTAFEGSALKFQATATDADLPANGLTFSLVNGPLGATLDSKTGFFSWTPDESFGGSTVNATIRVTDNGTPNLFDEETFQIAVTEVNLPPDLLPTADQELIRGASLSLAMTVTDPDTPANKFTFSLEPGAPFGAAVDPTTGVFTWSPLPTQTLTDYYFTIKVTDNGTPALSDSETFKVTLTNRPLIVTGANNGEAPVIHVYDVKAGTERFSLMAFQERFRGGVHVAVGDINGDGTPDVIAAMGNGSLPRIRAFSGVDGTPITSFGTNGEIIPYARTFLGGTWVATMDWNHDGKADVVVGPGVGQGSGGIVKIFSGANGQLLTSFKPYGNGYTGGVRVSTGDVNGDGNLDIVASPAAGMSIAIRVFNGTNLAMIDEFRGGFPNPNNPFGGYFTAVADLNEDGKGEIIITPGASQVPLVRIFDRTNFVNGVTQFNAEVGDYRYAVRVGITDLNRDGRPDILVGTRSFNARLSGTDGLSLSSLDSFFAGYQPELRGNLFVAGTL